MKTKKLDRKLSINKITITHLQTPEMENLKGGVRITLIEGCTDVYCDTVISCYKFCIV